MAMGMGRCINPLVRWARDRRCVSAHAHRLRISINKYSVMELEYLAVHYCISFNSMSLWFRPKFMQFSFEKDVEKRESSWFIPLRNIVWLEIIHFTVLVYFCSRDVVFYLNEGIPRFPLIDEHFVPTFVELLTLTGIFGPDAIYVWHEVLNASHCCFY